MPDFKLENDWILQKVRLAQADLEVIGNFDFESDEVERAFYDALVSLRVARKAYEKLKGVKRVTS